jgi:hypothetical protein
VRRGRAFTGTLVAAASALLGCTTLADPGDGSADLPVLLDGGSWPAGHVQGVAVDRDGGSVYYSFTDLLVKTDLDGAVVGTVEGLTGHLGDLDWNPDDGRVYGSLEYKDAAAFYIAVFDGDRVTRVGMSAEDDAVMTTVHLQDVADDFSADLDGDGLPGGDDPASPDHRYGTSGIDGVSFGPAFGRPGSGDVLTVAYGIYPHAGRTDNDDQVLLQYDVRDWPRFEQPLVQDRPHRAGPARADGRFFVRTGNTHYGVQNLEYDPSTDRWLMAVYPGNKPPFPAYSLFAVEADAVPVERLLTGDPAGARGMVLPLAPGALRDPATGISGWTAAGNRGLEALGDGSYYVAESRTIPRGDRTEQAAILRLHTWLSASPDPFGPVPDPR